MHIKETANIEFWMWFVLLFVIALVVFIAIITKIFYKNILRKEQILNENKLFHQKELLKTALLSQEKERSRIAQDLHDGLVSQLNIIRLSKKEDDKKMNEQLKECIATVRVISHDLMPPLIEHAFLDELLIKIIQSLETHVQIEIHKSIFEKSEMSTTTKLQIVRIVQEVTTNIMKHANARKVRFLLRITQQSVSLKVEDNGVGFDLEKAKGLGLKSIIARVQLLNGVYKFRIVPGSRTCFLLKVPLD